MLLKENPRRACIYFFFDKDGIVDRYVIEQLKDLKKNVEYLHCVINGRLTPEGRAAMKAVADEVYERENKGVDIGAYKAAINHIGWEKLSRYDELVLINSTCFGPVYPFKEVFDWAAKQDIEVWGLTCDTKAAWISGTKYLHYNKKNIFIQSYFYGIRRPLLGSQLLKDFFEEINDVDYVHSGCYFEYAFPGYFEERGYKSAVYCDIRDDYNYPLLHNPVRLLRECRMPLFKKRSFFHHYTDVLNNTAGEATARLVRFLTEETDYDMSLVWESVLRTQALSDIVRCAQLNRVLPADELVSSVPGKLKTGLVFHAYYQDLFDEDVLYICNFPQEAEVLVTTDTEDKKTLLEEKLRQAGRSGSVRVIENRGRDVSSLLVGAADFVSRCDLVCFAHEKKTSQIKPASVGRSWAYKLLENTMGSRDFVLNVINLFEKESCLGIAFPSPPNHSIYAASLGTGWSGNYENTVKLLNDFGIHVKTNVHALCVAPLGCCFWFRPAALNKLFAGAHGKKWTFESFPEEPNDTDQTILHAIERSYAYFAQDAGYYPVYLYNDKYTEIELTNLEFEKFGSEEMRIWVEAAALDTIGYKKLQDVYGKPADQITREDLLKHNCTVNYGIRVSLIHLAIALKCRFPRLWKVAFPFRKAAKFVLRIR